MTCDGAALDGLAGIADARRGEVVGEDITYVVNRDINFSNIDTAGPPASLRFQCPPVPARAVRADDDFLD